MNQNGRTHDIKIRMNDDERELLQEKLEQAGNISLQSYGLDALLKTQITSQQEIDLLIEMNHKISELSRIERGIGTNVNQIAKYVNTVAEADSETIKQVKDVIASNKEEREKVWQSIRLLLMHLRHMEQCGM